MLPDHKVYFAMKVFNLNVKDHVEFKQIGIHVGNSCHPPEHQIQHEHSSFLGQWLLPKGWNQCGGPTPRHYPRQK